MTKNKAKDNVSANASYSVYKERSSVTFEPLSVDSKNKHGTGGIKPLTVVDQTNNINMLGNTFRKEKLKNKDSKDFRINSDLKQFLPIKTEEILNKNHSRESNNNEEFEKNLCQDNDQEYSYMNTSNEARDLSVLRKRMISNDSLFLQDIRKGVGRIDFNLKEQVSILVKDGSNALYNSDVKTETSEKLNFCNPSKEKVKTTEATGNMHKSGKTNRTKKVGRNRKVNNKSKETKTQRSINKNTQKLISDHADPSKVPSLEKPDNIKDNIELNESLNKNKSTSAHSSTGIMLPISPNNITLNEPEGSTNLNSLQKKSGRISESDNASLNCDKKTTENVSNQSQKSSPGTKNDNLKVSVTEKPQKRSKPKDSVNVTSVPKINKDSADSEINTLKENISNNNSKFLCAFQDINGRCSKVPTIFYCHDHMEYIEKILKYRNLNKNIDPLSLNTDDTSEKEDQPKRDDYISRKFDFLMLCDRADDNLTALMEDVGTQQKWLQSFQFYMIQQKKNISEYRSAYLSNFKNFDWTYLLQPFIPNNDSAILNNGSLSNLDDNQLVKTPDIRNSNLPDIRSSKSWNDCSFIKPTSSDEQSSTSNSVPLRRSTRNNNNKYSKR